MDPLQRDFRSLIADWCGFVTGDAKPLHGHSTHTATPCKCEVHAWDVLAAGYISRHADIFMGLYYDGKASTPIDVEVLIGGIPVCVLKLDPGEKILAFEGVTFISMVSLCYHDVRVRPDDLSSLHHLHVIYAHLSTDARQEIQTKSLFFITPEHSRSALTRTCPVIGYASGMVHCTDQKPTWTNAVALPEFPDPHTKAAEALAKRQAARQAACQAQVQQFKKQLLETAWHPWRHIQWCLDIEDAKDLLSATPGSISSSLWYDEINVIESHELPTVKSSMKLVKHHNKNAYFCCLHSNGRICLKIKGRAARWLALDPTKPFWVRCTTQQSPLPL